MEINTNWKQYPEVCIDGADKLKKDLLKLRDKYSETSLKKHEKIVAQRKKFRKPGAMTGLAKLSVTDC